VPESRCQPVSMRLLADPVSEHEKALIRSAANGRSILTIARR
jgi:hypothetical protein